MAEMVRALDDRRLVVTAKTSILDLHLAILLREADLLVYLLAMNEKSVLLVR